MYCIRPIVEKLENSRKKLEVAKLELHPIARHASWKIQGLAADDLPNLALPVPTKLTKHTQTPNATRTSPIIRTEINQITSRKPPDASDCETNN